MTVTNLPRPVYHCQCGDNSEPHTSPASPASVGEAGAPGIITPAMIAAGVAVFWREMIAKDYLTCSPTDNEAVLWRKRHKGPYGVQ
jgi:hypothetical protein